MGQIGKSSTFLPLKKPSSPCYIWGTNFRSMCWPSTTTVCYFCWKPV